MNWSFIKGLIIGFSIAAPVGPIGVLCIQKTISKGQLAGLRTGLGAATADGIYGSIAAYGLSAISSFLVNQQLTLRSLGGLYLGFLGIKTVLSQPLIIEKQESVTQNLNDFLSTLILTLTNPITIVSFTAIYSGLMNQAIEFTFLSATLLVVGVFCGSALWWLFLSFIASRMQQRINATALLWINRISGIFIIGFSIGIFWSTFLPM